MSENPVPNPAAAEASAKSPEASVAPAADTDITASTAKL
jgi:hypothetical protein